MQIPKALKIRTMCRFRKGISNRFRSYFKVAGSLVVWSITNRRAAVSFNNCFNVCALLPFHLVW